VATIIFPVWLISGYRRLVEGRSKQMETGDSTHLRNGSDEQAMLSFHAVFIELYIRLSI